MTSAKKSPARLAPRKAPKKEPTSSTSLTTTAETIYDRHLQWEQSGREKLLERLGRGELLLHPACALFPQSGEADLATLTEDIRRSRRVLDPISFDRDGRIVDGRNRALALIALAREGEPVHRINLVWDVGAKDMQPIGNVKADVPTIIWELNLIELEVGDDEAAVLAWTVSKNLARRQLTESQRAAIAAELATLTARDAGKRRGTAGRADTDIEAKSSVGEAAAKLRVSPAAVQNAKRVKKAAPAAFEQIKAGATTVGAEVKKLRGGGRKAPDWKNASSPKPKRPPVLIEGEAVREPAPAAKPGGEQLDAFAEIPPQAVPPTSRAPSVLELLETAERLSPAELRELIGGLEGLLERLLESEEVRHAQH